MGSDDMATVPDPRVTRVRSGLPVIDPSHYELGEEIAQGGMGRIRAAVDRRLGREVAIKEVKEGRGHHAVRFEREALVTARLQHPSIVAVYEAGRWPSGEPFLAMKLVRGQPLKKVIERAAAFDARLALLPHVIAVADAMAYAHEHRVIHRDLKPSNVLVGDFGETVVIDWGIAKALDGEDLDLPAPAGASDAELTRDGTVIGTPNYMPPEQARGETVDERADVYAIGAMLYHLLAGEPPYKGSDSTRILADVTTKPPIPLAERERRVPPDLLAIVVRAMAREPVERYRSARELAEELRRFQTGQLVASHRYSRRELVLRFMRRNRGVLAVAAAAVLVLAGVGAFSFFRIVKERDASRAAELRAEREKAIAIDERDRGLIAHAQSIVERDPDAALRALQQLSRGTKQLAAAHVIAADAREHVVPRTIEAHHNGVAALAVSLDGKTIATAGANRMITLWNTATGTRRNIGRHAMRIYDVALTPDGSTVASASDDRSVRVWRTESNGDPIVLVHRSPVVSIAFSPDGELLASSDAEGVHVWRIADQQIVAQAPHTATTLAFAFSPPALLYQSGSELYRLDIADGKARLVARVTAWTLSFDRKYIATATKAGLLQRWDTATWQPTVVGEWPSARRLALSRDANTLAVATESGLFTWRVGAKPPMRSHSLSMSNEIRAIEFSADGNAILVRSEHVAVTYLDIDGAVTLPGGEDADTAVFAGDRVYAARRGALVSWPWRPPRRFVKHVDFRATVHYLDDGTLLVADRGAIQIGERRIALPFEVTSNVAFDATFKRAAMIGGDRKAHVVELATGAMRDIPLSASEDLFFLGRVTLDRTGRWLAIEESRMHAKLRLVDVTTLAEREVKLPVYATELEFTDDGSQLLVHTGFGELHVIDTVSGAMRKADVPVGVTAAYLEDSRVVVADVAAKDWWTVTSPRPIQSVALSPDRSLLAFCDMDGVVAIYAVKERKQVASFQGGNTLAFSADNTLCIAGSTIYSLETGLTRRIRDGAEVHALAISRDRKRIAAASDELVREWFNDIPRDEAGLRAWIDAALK